MRLFLAASILALLAGAANAQNQAPIPQYGDLTSKTPQQIEEEKAADRAYKKSLGNVPDKGPVDPWGNARSVGEPKADAKATAKATAAKPKTKTGGTVN